MRKNGGVCVIKKKCVGNMKWEGTEYERSKVGRKLCFESSKEGEA